MSIKDAIKKVYQFSRFVGMDESHRKNFAIECELTNNPSELKRMFDHFTQEEILASSLNAIIIFNKDLTVLDPKYCPTEISGKDTFCILTEKKKLPHIFDDKGNPIQVKLTETLVYKYINGIKSKAYLYTCGNSINYSMQHSHLSKCTKVELTTKEYL